MRLAARLFWWKPAQEALALPQRFLAQVMVLGTWEDVEIARKHWTDDDFRQVLNEPPAGLFDPRSWSYWHRVLGLGPAPPLPTRRLLSEASRTGDRGCHTAATSCSDASSVCRGSLANGVHAAP